MVLNEVLEYLQQLKHSGEVRPSFACVGSDSSLKASVGSPIDCDQKLQRRLRNR